MRLFIAIVFVASSVVSACGKKETAPASSSSESASPAPAAEPAKVEWKKLKLEKEGVTVLAPADAKPSEIGGLSALNYECQAMMNVANEGMHESFESTLKNVEKGNYGGPPKEIRRKDKKTDTDYVIEWVGEGKWGYESSKSLAGGKSISCGRVSRSEAGHDCVVKVCESIEP